MTATFSDPRGKLHFQLAGAHPHAIAAAQQEFKIFKHLGGKNLCEGSAEQNLSWPHVRRPDETCAAEPG